MAKINIPFNGADYLVDESALAATTTGLQSHLQTEMSGTGATIYLGGNTYNVDSTKLTNERNAFTTYLGTIAGSGSKVIVNGVEYGVDSSKTSAAVTELETVLGNLSSGAEPIMKSAGLYQTGTDVIITSWDDLVANSTVYVNNGAVSTNYDTKKYTNSSSSSLAGDLVLPDDGSITSFDTNAFRHCEQLSSIAIPDSIATSNLNAFLGCSALQGLYVKNVETLLNINFSSKSANPLYCAKNLYVNNELITNLIIPNGCTEIKQYTYVCFNGASVTIPDSVRSIGEYAFEDCSSLENIYIDDIGKWCNISGLNYLMEYGISKQLYINNKVATKIALPNSVTSIGDCAFKGCSSLTGIEIPDSVTSIGSHAFYGCSGLTSIEIPDSVTTIGDSAFGNCVAEIKWGENPSITQIGRSAFADYKGTSIIIPNGVTSIGDWAFYRCSALISIEIPDSVTTIGLGAFQECSGLTKITIPDNVTSIQRICMDCSGLVEVIMSANARSITWKAFGNCSNVLKYDFSRCTIIPYFYQGDPFLSVNDNCKFIVPDSLYDEWISNSDWDTYASYIIKASEYVA